MFIEINLKNSLLENLAQTLAADKSNTSFMETVIIFIGTYFEVHSK